MNLASVIATASDDTTALIDGSNRLSYGSLREQVARTAGALQQSALAPGDHVGILAGNNPSFVVSLLACWHAGMVAVPINHQEPAATLEKYLGLIEPRALLGGTSQQALDAMAIAQGLGHDLALAATPSGSPIPDLPTADGEPVPCADQTSDTTAMLLFTSGVSGRPRPATLTHGNLSATHAALANRSETQLTDGTVSLGALPMVHILGLNVSVLSTLRTGGTTVLQSHWSPDQTMELIGEYGINTLVLVPRMWDDLASVDEIPEAALANVRLARCGAAELHPSIATRVHDRLGIELGQGYGLTETAGTVTYEPNARLRPGSVGVPLDHVEIRVVDEGDVDAEPGDLGEIWIRGECVFGGYHGGDPDSDTAVLDNGWLKTGDIGVIDDGLYIVGREKDMISVSGFKISPIEVEEVLEASQEIDEALVVGEPDERTGERVVAYVIPDPAAAVVTEDLQTHVRDHLARYKVPRDIYVVEELPRNLLGKRIRSAVPR